MSKKHSSLDFFPHESNMYTIYYTCILYCDTIFLTFELILILKLAKQIIIRGYLLLESLDLL